MLKKIKITNFCSIKNEQEIDLEIGSKDVLDESAYYNEKANCYLNNVTSIVGPNASGKTNFLKALSFLSWFIEDSYSSKTEDHLPASFLHKLSPDKNSILEIEFFEGNILYTYRIEFDKSQIVKERLDKKVERINKNPIFELIRNKDKADITSTSLSINDHDKERIIKRTNISFLSGLIALGYLPEITFFKKISTNIGPFGHVRLDMSDSVELSQALYEDELLRKDVLKLSQHIDLGISDFAFQELITKSRENIENKKTRQILMCVHNSREGSFSLPIFVESNGTQYSYSIISKILPILQKGGLVVLDEIDDGLHPEVIKKIISLFESKETNPNNAQLIFSTHQHLLLNDRTKTQIFITNKNNDSLSSEIYRLDDVENVRNDENYFHKYISGSYGGTPNIKWI